MCGWTICVTCNKYILHANCISLTGSKLVEARERDPPISAATRRRSRSCAASPSRAPVLAAAQQQAVSAIVRRTVTIHLRSTSIAFHHPQHAIALNWLRLRRLRLRRLLPVCLPLWLQLPTPSPAPLLEPALLVTGLQTRSQSQSSFCPGPSPAPSLPQPIPNGQSTLRLSLTLWDCGFCPQPTDRSQQTNWHSLDSNERGKRAGDRDGKGGQRDVPQDRR